MLPVRDLARLLHYILVQDMIQWQVFKFSFFSNGKCCWRQGLKLFTNNYFKECIKKNKITEIYETEKIYDT